MTIKPIIILPDPVLRQVSSPVERIDDDLQRLLDDMLETMYDAPGIGLAGIQVGVPLRIITVDVSPRTGDGEDEGGDEGGNEGDSAPPAERERKPLFLINPEIVKLGDSPSVYEEGCLSIPDYYAEVERPDSVTVRYLDRQGREQTLEADGLLSTCLQHEIDHLDGKLFIDLLSRLKRDMVVKKFTKAAKQGGSARMVG
ncbi:MAG: peptide deformylase [Pseudomonadota bacterium]|nr:peptide deformylase [Pseudomonadota bacterium]